jgi:hypothetical protein
MPLWPWNSAAGGHPATLGSARREPSGLLPALLFLLARREASSSRRPVMLLSATWPHQSSCVALHLKIFISIYLFGQYKQVKKRSASTARQSQEEKIAQAENSSI